MGHSTLSQHLAVYLLFVNKARVPAWVLAKGFHRLEDYSLQVAWELELAFKIIAVMTKKLDDCKSAMLHIYESDAIYEPHKPHSFGGMGGKRLLDYTYVFMWRPLQPNERSGEKQGGGDMHQDAKQDAAALDAEENRRLRLRCRQDILSGVQKGKLDEVWSATTRYRRLLARAAGGAGDTAAGGPLPVMVVPTAAVGGGGVRAPALIDDGGSSSGSSSAASSSSADEAGSRQSRVGGSGGAGTDPVAEASAAATASGSGRAGGGLGQPHQRSRRFQDNDHRSNGAESHARFSTAPRLSYAVEMPPDAPRPAFVTTRGELLTHLAVHTDNCPAAIVPFLVSQGAELDADGFRHVLANTKVLPACGYRSVSHFALSYVWAQRNPIASAMVMAQPMTPLPTPSTSVSCRELGEQLRVLARCLVERLEWMVVAESLVGLEEAEEEGQGADGPAAPTLEGNGSLAAPQLTPTLEDVLAPRGVALSINDAQPMQVAYDHDDDEFMATGVVQEYCQARWKGAFYRANALIEVQGTSAVHFRDNRLVFKLLHNAGFVGSLGEPVLLLFSRMAHMLLLSSRSYFESPRGRWAFRLLCEAFLLYVFHAVQLIESEEGLTWQHGVLTLYVLSMVVDETQEIAHKFQRRLLTYFTDGFNVIEAVTISLLLASGGCKIGMLVLPDTDPSWQQLRTAKDFLFNTTAIFLWMRALQFLIPLVGGLGALLMVINKMVWEVLKFAVPGLMIMMGVSFTLYGTFRDRDLPSLDSFANVLLLLFRTFLGETMFDVMHEEKATLFNLYGNVIVLLFALAGTVVLANLLIAILSYHFKPEKVESQSKFQSAEILKQYEYKVTRHLLGAPFSLPLLLLDALLPSGTRTMLPPESATVLFSLGVMVPDGNPEPGKSAQSSLLPTGTAELPYLVFLLTYYPLHMAATWALGLAMAPYCVLTFAIKGASIWLPEGLAAMSTPHWSAAATPLVDGKDGGAGHKRGAKVAPADSDHHELLDATEEDGGTERAHLGAGGARDGNTRTQRLLRPGVLLLQCGLFAVTRLALAVLGAAVYVGGIMVLCCVVWLGLHQYAARLVFSAFCVGLGWLQGWFGCFHILGVDGGASAAVRALVARAEGADEERSPAAPEAAAAAMGASTHAMDARWVRVNQAALKDRGQVLSKREIEAAMRDAQFSRAQEELRRCDCPKHLAGDDCRTARNATEVRLLYDRKFRPLPWPCLNNCSSRGVCTLYGDCVCDRGFFGSDCSVSLDPATRRPLLLVGRGYVPRRKRPLVYVYDIPHNWSSWHNYDLVDRSLTWVFWERLLGSGALTADGEEADWYFIPIKLRSTRDGLQLAAAVAYLRRAWPWWDRLQGHRHFVIHTGDTGRGEVLEAARSLTANVTWLHHWGLTVDQPRFNMAHRPGKDVVTPIYFGGSQGVSYAPMSGLHPRAPRLQRPNELLFAGRICGDSSAPDPRKPWPHCATNASSTYSQGVRQRVHFHHHMRPGYKIVTRDPTYAVDLLSYKWCLSPSGGGHGHRQTLGALLGCLPVIASDHVLQPFEPELPWGQFALRIAQADIPTLHEALGAVDAAAYQRMQDAARCAAQHLVFSSLSGAFMQEDGRWDAFEMILEILRMQQTYPDLDPAQYAATDEAFRSFVNCGEADMGAFGAKARAAAAARYPQPLTMPGLPNGTALAWEHLYEKSGGGLSRLLTHTSAASVPGTGTSPAPLPLCSRSRWDPAELSCGRRGWRQRAYGMGRPGGTAPGGAACNEADDVATCPRLWP
ncbi:hypothetical protein HYH03_014547 [Edaphochlamys debaryana]|uniref:EGF-like domain-containing protein n=1 Tax=Edaphochlamys debaryana TaxID=47281 RepID=A0A836BTI1_9CHLO|nr:hypothetical protein HYH03_014547 [Edaphochlamys debaryana]|eukprot:KAG2486864.1 hypothetical protein HYH03_014547 [Edaphochlamys debaryana]